MNSSPENKKQGKVKEWLIRYLPAEILSVIITLLAASITFRFTNNLLTTAFAATWAGNVAYFGTILLTDIRKTRKIFLQNNSAYKFKNLLKNIRALAVEFGFAEVIDSFFIRPALMYYLPKLTGDLSTGILIAKLLADVTFYIPAIIGYEFSKKKYRNFD